MIAFVGAGKVATALGLYFKTKGMEVTGYYSRNHEHAKKAAETTNTRAYTNLTQLINSSRMIWITTTDDSLEEVAFQIAGLSIEPDKEKLFLHTSGVHSTDVLRPIKEKGFTTGSAHPLLSFSAAESTAEKLRETWFTIECNEDEGNELPDFFKKTNNPVLRIDSKHKALYHTACSMLANYLVTLTDISYQIFENAGIEKETMRKATIPLLESVLENTKNKEGKEALTGPVKRGDINTIKLHLESLQNSNPEFVEIYKVLGRLTMNMLGDFRLSEIL